MSLTATDAGTCNVTATRGTQTGTASFTFTAAPPLSVTGSPEKAAVGTAIALYSAGGTGTTTVTYATTSTGCVVTGNSLTATAAGTCTVIATKGTQGRQTATASFTFLPAGSPTLTVTGNPATAAVGTTITLYSAGGSPTRRVTYATTSTGCQVTGASLTATAAGTCTVTAT